MKEETTAALDGFMQSSFSGTSSPSHTHAHNHTSNARSSYLSQLGAAATAAPSALHLFCSPTPFVLHLFPSPVPFVLHLFPSPVPFDLQLFPSPPGPLLLAAAAAVAAAAVATAAATAANARNGVAAGPASMISSPISMHPCKTPGVLSTDSSRKAQINLS
eukprot:scaffold54163_cov20-Tisochrysis_lutea.AAC.1